MNINWSAPAGDYSAEQLYKAMRERFAAELVAVVPGERVQNTEYGDYDIPPQKLALQERWKPPT